MFNLKFVNLMHKFHLKCHNYKRCYVNSLNKTFSLMLLTSRITKLIQLRVDNINKFWNTIAILHSNNTF